MRILPVLCACLLAAAARHSAQAQNYDRIITASDISYAPSPVPGGGWVVRATVWLANESPAPLDMGCRLTLAVNGVPLGSTEQSVMVSNAGGGAGGSGCGTSCVTDGWCAACKESVIVPGTCYCCNNSVSTEFTVPALLPGDVIAAWVVALPGAAAEIAGANDGAIVVVPVPGATTGR